MELTRDAAQQILASRGLISGPTRVKARVNSVTEVTDEDGNMRAIVNFNLWTPAHISGWTTTNEEGETVTTPSIKQLIDEEKYDEACNRNLSTGQRVGKDFIPKAGSFVMVDIDNIETKSGVKGLFITNIEAVQVEAVKKFDITSLFGDVEETEAPSAEELKEELAGKAK